MQDKHKFKQLGLIYEGMISRGEGGPPNPSNPNFGDRTMSVKIQMPVKVGQLWLPAKAGRNPAGPMITLRYDKTALEPFLSKQNDDINQFLVALGVPDNGQNGPHPFELLPPSTIDYLVRMLNKEFGTTFSYDDGRAILTDAGPEDED